MSNELQNSIIKTLAYFDGFNFPLTRPELFARLWQPPFLSYPDFSDCLDKNISSVPWENSAGFYFLPGQSGLIAERNRRLLDSVIGLKSAQRAVKKIRAVPFLRAVFVCNSVGAGTAHSDSDIDLLIVARVGRVWLARFFINLILLFWCLRTRGKNSARKVCLSFFIDMAHLDMSAWRVAEDDIHFAYWLHQMVPIYDPANIYQAFITANHWTDKFLPNIKQPFDYIHKIIDSRLGRIWKNIWEFFFTGVFGDILEAKARNLQMLKLRFRLKDKINNRLKGVILGAGVIKLHENDTRALWRARWLEKISKL